MKTKAGQQRARRSPSRTSKNSVRSTAKTPGHPEYGFTVGVETTTGPLGQGCGNSVGMAMAPRWLGAHYNKDGATLFDYDVYTMCSDGDMMEGVASEAASLAGHLGLVQPLLDLRFQHDQHRGRHADLAFSEDVAKRFEAYQWHVLHVWRRQRHRSAS